MGGECQLLLSKLLFSIWTLNNLFPRSSLAEKYASDNGVDPSHVVLVGHSSGAQAALRYAEKYAVDGIVLVSAAYSDLGDAHERASGYYPQQQKNVKGEKNPYLFDEMKKNCPLWHQFHSDDDPFIQRKGFGMVWVYPILTICFQGDHTFLIIHRNCWTRSCPFSEL
jgi:pimeloyl-ACP methyl ester carboxylesterase